MKFRIGLSLKRELMIYVVMFVIFSAVSVGICMYKIYKADIRMGITDNLSAFARQVAARLRNVKERPVLFNSFQRSMSFLDEGGDVVGVAIYDRNGMKVGEKKSKKFERCNIFKPKIRSSFCEPIEGGGFLHMRFPVGSLDDVFATTDSFESVSVAASLVDMNDRMARLFNLGIVVLSVVLLTGIFLAVLFARFLLSPINNLIMGTTRVVGGDLSYKVPTYSTVELNSLSSSFNLMSQKLKQSIENLEQERSQLSNVRSELQKKNEDLKKAFIKIEEIQDKLLMEEKSATVGRISASVAHELNNPLTSLNNVVYFLLRTDIFGDEKSKRMLRMLSEDVLRASNVIRGLLCFSEADNVPKKVVVYIDEIINGSLDRIGILKNITVTKELEHFEVLVDPDKIKQVVENFMVNAKDAMPEGGCIFISVKRINKMVEIKIKDSGIGIKKDDVNRIFEPLFTTKLKGIGFGLCVVKEIVSLHLGTVSVDSVEGYGTEFKVVIPIVV